MFKTYRNKLKNIIICLKIIAEKDGYRKNVSKLEIIKRYQKVAEKDVSKIQKYCYREDVVKIMLGKKY